MKLFCPENRARSVIISCIFLSQHNTGTSRISERGWQMKLWKGHRQVIIATVLTAVTLLTGCNQHDGHDGNKDHEHADHDHTSNSGKTATGIQMCNEHGVPEARCAICQPDLAATLLPGESLQLRLPSTNSAALVGIRTALPESRDIADGVECIAEISFDPGKVSQVATPVGGIIQSVAADLGQHVAEKQTLASIWSSSIAEAVARAVLSHQTLDRERKLRAGRVTSEKELQEAEAAHRAACQQLRTLGFTEEQIDGLAATPQDRVLMEVRAPFAGEIADRSAVRGALVEPGKSLFTVVDYSVVWAMLQVPEIDLGKVKNGQIVELRLDSLPDRVFTGKLTWIAPAVDERTRMIRVRAEFNNPDGLLKDKMFAKAKILLRRASAALLVPAAAIQRINGRPFAFIKQSEALFEARAVTLGTTAGDQQEIIAGINPQEEVAAQHTYALKSAMLMSRLGAGCADD